MNTREIALPLLPILLLALLLTGGCSTGKSGPSPRQVTDVQYGVVEEMHVVQLDEPGDASLLGVGAGALLGGIVGHQFGSGTGRTLATVGGALAGAAAGYGAEKALSRKNGLEIRVRLDNGEKLSVVQDGNTIFDPGERVRVERDSAGAFRVTR